MKIKNKILIYTFTVIFSLLIVILALPKIAALPNSTFNSESEFASYAFYNKEGFIRGIKAESLVGTQFINQISASPINTFSTAMCIGHISLAEGNVHYRIDNIIDIDENSNTTIWGFTGDTNPILKHVTLENNSTGVQLAYLAKYAAENPYTPDDMKNATKLALRSKLLTAIQGEYLPYIDSNTYITKLIPEYDDLHDVTAIGGVKNYLGAAAANAATVNSSTSFEDITDETKVEIIRQDNKTYLGPYKINFAGVSVQSADVTINGQVKNVGFATRTDGKFEKTTILTSKMNFYLVIDEITNAKAITKISIHSSYAKRILGRIALISCHQGSQQNLIVYNAMEKEVNYNKELTIPEEKATTFQLNIEKLDNTFKEKMDATFNVKYADGTTQTVITKNGVLTLAHETIIDGEETVTLTETAVSDPTKYLLLKKPITIKITKKKLTTSYGAEVYVADTAIVSGDPSEVENVTYTFENTEANDTVVATLKDSGKITIYDETNLLDGEINLKLDKLDSKATSTTLSGAQFKIDIDGKQYIEKAVTDSTGNLNITGIKIGSAKTYTVTLTETIAPNHFELLKNPIVLKITTKPDKATWSYVVDKVELEENDEVTMLYNTEGAKTTISLKAKDTRKTITLSGYVWEDVKKAKESLINGIKEDDENYINGMKVTLHTEDGSKVIYTDSAVQEARTGMNNKDGYYEFVVPEYDKGYYIEFTYNGQVYQHTYYTPWSTSSSTETKKTSNSTETETARNDLNAALEEISPITTATSSEKTAVVNSAINSKDAVYISYNEYNISAFAGSNGSNKDKLNIYSTTSTEINLGVTKREKADLAIQKDVYKANISIKGYSQDYIYNKREGLTTGQDGEKYWEIATRASDAYYNSDYTRDIRPSDYSYTGEKPLTSTVTYKITIKNQSEGINAKVTELVDYYDSDYTYNSAYIGDSQGNKIGDIVGTTTSKYNVDTAIDNYNKIYFTGTGSTESNRNDLTETALKPSEYVYIYVTFNVKADKLLDLTDSGKGNITEIMGYKTYYEGNTAPNEGNSNTYTEYKAGDIAGRIDSDSNPGNVTSLENAQVEDDGDKAPYIKFQLSDDDRTITGNVWLDSRNQKVDENAQVGNGIMDSSEGKISGVKVELYEILGNNTIELAHVYNNSEKKWNTDGGVITTANDGSYSISGYLPGNYYVQFTYPDGQTYKSAIYNPNAVFDINNPDEVGKYVETSEHYSDARDLMGNEQNATVGTRTYANSLLKEETNGKLASYTSPEMRAITGTIIANIEKNDGNTVVDGKNDSKYTFDNIDFGIQERAKAQLELNKEVTNVKVTLANGSVLFDAEGKGTTNVWWTNKENHSVSYNENLLNIPSVRKAGQIIQLTMDEELMYGSTVKISYAIKVTNVGEVDYTSNKFYYTGKKADNDKIAKTKIYDIIDYVGATMTDDSKATIGNLKFSAAENEGWSAITANELIDGKLVSDNIKDEVSKYSTIVKYNFDKELSPKLVDEANSSVTANLVLSQVISSDGSTDDLTYNNVAEIIKVSNDNSRRMAYSTVGSQSPMAEISEIDSDSAQTVTILPPFGQAYIYYVLGFGIAIITILGIVIIKKKIIRK